MATTRAWTDDEYRRLLAACRGRTALRDRCLIVLLRRAGFRISEALSLRLADVVEAGRIRDEIQVARRYMKGRREGRIVPVHAEARAALAAWVGAMAQEGWQTADTCLFRRMGRENRPLSRVQAWRMIQTVAKGPDGAGLAGCIGTHSGRKAFAWEIYERSGHDLRRTQVALGHTSIESTIHYLGVEREDVRGLILGHSGGTA